MARAAQFDGSRVVSLAPQVVTSEPDGTLSGSVRMPDGDVTDIVAVRVCGAGSGLALLNRSEFTVATEHSDIDPVRPTALCDVTGARPVRTVPMTPDEAALVIRDWAVLTVAETVGEMYAVLAATVAYTQQREQFGRSIGGFQAIKHQLADMHVVAEQARAAVQFAAIGCDRASASATTDVAAAARWVPRVAIEMFDSAIHLHGAMGYTWELGVHLHLRRSVAAQALLRESRVTETSALDSETGLAS